MNTYDDDYETTARINRMIGNGDRFDNYREIKARFDSMGACGHPIKKGDVIGYNPRKKVCRCATCLNKWSAENQEADAIENGYLPQCL